VESLIYNSAWYDILSGNISTKSSAINCMLVGAGYTPDKRTHSRRSHIGNEVRGSGYVAGGTPVSASVELTKASDTIYLVFGDAFWPNSTITADGAVYFNRRGGSALDDELIAFIAFKEKMASINGDVLLSGVRLWINNSENMIA
jgi:hypothetical protein